MGAVELAKKIIFVSQLNASGFAVDEADPRSSLRTKDMV
jgi:hypothetical protein